MLDMNEKYARAFQVEIPDILDRLSANSHSLQTYNVKIKRLDDIVQDVNKKNARFTPLHPLHTHTPRAKRWHNGLHTSEELLFVALSVSSEFYFFTFKAPK